RSAQHGVHPVGRAARLHVGGGAAGALFRRQRDPGLADLRSPGADVEVTMIPAERFSNRVSYYDGGRPGYPDAAFSWLTDTFDLEDGASVADVGAGTGISASLFLRHGFTVTAVEPNGAMREAAIA